MNWKQYIGTEKMIAEAKVEYANWLIQIQNTHSTFYNQTILERWLNE